MSLPPNPKLLKEFELMSKDIVWSKVLNLQSPFSLLYSLHIVESILSEDSKVLFFHFVYNEN